VKNENAWFVLSIARKIINLVSDVCLSYCKLNLWVLTEYLLLVRYQWYDAALRVCHKNFQKFGDQPNLDYFQKNGTVKQKPQVCVSVRVCAGVREGMCVCMCLVRKAIFSCFVMVDIWQATGIRLGTAIQSISSIVTGIIIAFVYSWELSLFIIGLSPFFAVGGYLEMKIMVGLAGSEELEGAGQVSLLLCLAVCTVHSSWSFGWLHALFYSDLLFTNSYGSRIFCHTVVVCRLV